MLIVDILLVEASFDCNSRQVQSIVTSYTETQSEFRPCVHQYSLVFVGIKEFIIKEIYISLVMTIDLLF